jgi:hypothetical protein
MVELFDFGVDEDGEPFRTFIVSAELSSGEGQRSRKKTDRQELALRALADPLQPALAVACRCTFRCASESARPVSEIATSAISRPFRVAARFRALIYFFFCRRSLSSFLAH